MIATFSNCGNFLKILILDSKNSILVDKLAAKPLIGCSPTTKCKWVQTMDLKYSLLLRVIKRYTGSRIQISFAETTFFCVFKHQIHIKYQKKLYGKQLFIQNNCLD